MLAQNSITRTKEKKLPFFSGNNEIDVVRFTKGQNLPFFRHYHFVQFLPLFGIKWAVE